MAQALTAGAPDRYTVLRESGRWSEAAALLKDAPAALPERIAFRHQALAQLGRYAEAFAEGERYLDAGPTAYDMRVFWSPAQDATFEKTLAAGFSKLRALENKKPFRPWAAYYHAVLSPDMGPLAALEAVAELSSPRYRFLQSPIGRHHLLRSHFAEALAHLKQGLAGRPFDWRTHSFMGETLLCLGRKGEARAEFSRAVAAALEGEQKAQARAWRGESNMWLGRYDEALPDLEAACDAASLFAYSWRAGALLMSGDAAGALKRLDESAILFPTDPEQQTWRGEALRVLGRNDEALRVLSARPPGLWGRFNRGLVRFALGDERGLLSDYWSIPAPLRARLMKKISLPLDREPNHKQKADVLAAALSLARGYRREDSYGTSIWLPDA